jgi:hypothetical protein
MIYLLETMVLNGYVSVPEGICIVFLGGAKMIPVTMMMLLLLSSAW